MADATTSTTAETPRNNEQNGLLPFLERKWQAYREAADAHGGTLPLIWHKTKDAGRFLTRKTNQAMHDIEEMGFFEWADVTYNKGVDKTASLIKGVMQAMHFKDVQGPLDENAKPHEKAFNWLSRSFKNGVNSFSEDTSNRLDRMLDEGRKGFHNLKIVDFTADASQNKSLRRAQRKVNSARAIGAVVSPVGTIVTAAGFALLTVPGFGGGMPLIGAGGMPMVYGVTRLRKANTGQKQIPEMAEKLSELHKDPEISQLLNALTEANDLLDTRNYRRSEMKKYKEILAENGVEFSRFQVKLGDDIEQIREAVCSAEALNTIRAARLVQAATRKVGPVPVAKRLTPEQAQHVMATVDKEFGEITKAHATHFDISYETGTRTAAAPAATAAPAPKQEALV